MCCSKYVKNGGGNGAASLSPSVQAIYSTQSNNCAGGAVVGNAPFLVSPDDFSSVPPVAQVPVIQRLGRRHPNNRYIFVSPPAGVIQVQSSKVGRY